MNLKVIKRSRGIRLLVDPHLLEIDLRKGGLISALQIGQKKLVHASDESPLFATLFESSSYDGIGDFAQGEFLPAAYESMDWEHHTVDETFELISRGALRWSRGDSILFELHLKLSSELSHIDISVKLSPKGKFRNRFLREIGFQLPLALSKRKRVVQAGDRGVTFDTRTNFQFHTYPRGCLLPEPDHNFWQHFHIDQRSSCDYHIWRAESLSTSSLSMFRGREAAGWMTACDQSGGVLFAYKDMVEMAPKSLYFNATEGGLARIFFHSSTHSAVDFQDKAAGHRIFGRMHETNWIFFEGDRLEARLEHRLAAIWKKQDLPIDGPVRADPVIEKIQLWNSPCSEGDTTPYISGGLPLPKGAITSPEQIRLFRDETELPVQARPLAYWPDQSIKWLLLTFSCDGKIASFKRGTGQRDEIRFCVTMRGEKKESFRLQYGKMIANGRTKTPLEVSSHQGEVHINTGPLQLILGRRDRWLQNIKLKGRELLQTDDQSLLYADFLQIENVYPPGTTHAQGLPEPGEWIVEDLKIEEAGPLRAVIRMEGKTRGLESTRIILRLEAYAGRSFVRLFHSTEFLHKDPRRSYVQGLGLRIPLKLQGKNPRILVGGQNGSMEVSQARHAGLKQTSHLHYEIWRQKKGKRYCETLETNHRSRGWLDIADRKVGVTVALRNMWQEFPKELRVDAKTGAVSIELWPSSESLMDVRRYSNYPHSGQGETVSTDSFWVDQAYYPHDPFVGVSKSSEILLFFHDAQVDTEKIDSLVADFQEPALVYAGAKWYAESRVTLQQILPDDPRFQQTNRNLENMARFWLFHQKYWGWYGMWDYGDLQHHLQVGFGQILPPEDLEELIKLSPDLQEKFPHRHRQDYFTSHDWAYDNGRWGWSNTEGLPNLFIQMQYLRTGDRELYFLAEALACHARDVDMRHDGKWFGLGTRHGVQHWSDGDHEERQTIHSEFRYHHYLSGDMRSRDFSEQLAHGYYNCGICSVDADHSGRLYGLLTFWEMTGSPEMAEVLQNYVSALITPEGISCSAIVNFPGGDQMKQHDVNSQSMFFHDFGALHALLEYYELTHDEKLKKALIQLGHATLERVTTIDRGENRLWSWKALAFAARHATDPTPYRKEIFSWMTGDRWREAFHTLSNNPSRWTGEHALHVPEMTVMPVSQWWINDQAYVMALLGEEPKLPSACIQEMKALDQDLPHSKPVKLRESWQSEYDRPEFKKFLTPKRSLEP